jgi:HAE1 family hydrophobic/amphiphilic exporter-1
LRFHLSSDWEKDRLYDFVENVLQRRLERLEGVAQIDIWGLKKRELQIQINPARMRAHGLDVRDLSAVLRDNNFNLSGGFVKEGSRKLLVRAMGEFKTAHEVRNLPINGVRLGDLAQVEYTYPRQDEYNFLNDGEALTVRVYKASTANLLEVVDRVKDEIEEIQEMPRAAGLSVRYYRDASVDVRKGLGQLRNAGLLGGALAITFLFIFLRRFRTTLLVAISIPLSVVLTFVIMYFSRQLEVTEITINIISLMGLMLALGMLVDNSIVVIESIFRHHEDLGEDARTAALRGTSEVAMPIMASTATTICVFVPLIFLGSVGGFMRFMTDIGTTIMVVMVASLLVALTVVPMVAAFLLRGEAPRGSSLVESLTRGYGFVIGFSLRHRIFFIIAIVAMLYGSWALFGTIERTFSPRSMERQVRIYIDTPRHYSFEQIQSLYSEVAELLDGRREELDISDIVYNYTRQGGRSRGGWRGSKKFDIFLVDEENAKLTTREARERIREALPVKAGVNFKIATSSGHGGGRFGVQMEIMGDDMAVLELLSEKVVAGLEELPWVRDVDTSLESGDEEIRVEVDRERALQAGLSTRAVAHTINNALSTRPVTRLKSDDREIDLVMQFREEDRQTLDQLKKTPVFASEAVLPIDALAEFEVRESARTIERIDRRPRITITANTVSQATSFRQVEQVRAISDSIGLPPGYQWTFGRWERHAQSDMGNAAFGIVFALLLIYLIMAALFESFVQPLTIMFSIPFAFIGVGIILKLTNQPLDNMTNLGLIILVGVVVNNAIVLIDHINHLRWQGMSRNEAIVVGGKHRLRPILMTALTTILGLTPMVAPLIFPSWLGSPEGWAGNWAPVGLVIMGGLTTSTFLTLVIIPTIYSLIDDFAIYWKRVIHAA